MPRPAPALDGRTRPARLLRAYQLDLVRKVGDPSLAAQFLIARAAQIQFRLSEETITDSREYTTLVDELAELLSRLGLNEERATA